MTITNHEEMPDDVARALYLAGFLLDLADMPPEQREAAEAIRAEAEQAVFLATTRLETPGALWRYMAKVDTSGGPDACHLWTASTTNGGYGKFDVKGSAGNAHRFAIELVDGLHPSTAVAMHTCDTPLCCNPRHLVFGTTAENVADKIAKGRGAHGARLPQTRLTEADKVAIRALVEGGMSLEKTAGQFGVTAKTIRRVAPRKAG